MVIEADAVEGARAQIAELVTRAPAGGSDEFGAGWLGAVQAVVDRLVSASARVRIFGRMRALAILASVLTRVRP